MCILDRYPIDTQINHGFGSFFFFLPHCDVLLGLSSDIKNIKKNSNSQSYKKMQI
jgi:hypothetical protein